MKIVESNILFNAVSEYDEFYQSNQEQIKEQHSKLKLTQNTLSDSSEERSGKGINNRLNLPTLIIDKVSITSAAQNFYESRYSSKVESESQVFFKDEAKSVDHQQLDAVEKIVSGVFDQKIALKSINKKIDANAQGNINQTGRLESDKSVDISKSNGWSMLIKQTDIHHEEQKMNLNSQGYVTTEDGRKIDFSLTMELNSSFHMETRQEDQISIYKEEVVLTDPLVVNLKGTAPELSDMTFEFDLNSDGRKEDVHFLKPGSGFLVFDKNNDHIVNNGKELFGPQSGNGFNDLAQYDEDNNNWIDENDAIYSKLSVWTKDAKGNDVLTPLKDADVGAISLSNAETDFQMTGSDNSLKGKLKRTGLFFHEDGRVGSVQQIDLAVKNDNLESLNGNPDNSQAMTPLDQTMEIKSGISEENNKKMLAARLEAQQFSRVNIEEPFNPFKEMMEMIKKLKKEMQDSMENKSHKHGFDLRNIRFDKFGLYQQINPESEFTAHRFEHLG